MINWKDQVKFDQLKRSSKIWSTDKKKSFDQTPNLTENFNQLKMSSKIRSSDHSPCQLDVLSSLNIKTLFRSKNVDISKLSKPQFLINLGEVLIEKPLCLKLQIDYLTLTVITYNSIWKTSLDIFAIFQFSWQLFFV